MLRGVLLAIILEISAHHNRLVLIIFKVSYLFLISRSSFFQYANFSCKMSSYTFPFFFWLVKNKLVLHFFCSLYKIHEFIDFAGSLPWV